jgi:hypothetical protein
VEKGVEKHIMDYRQMKKLMLVAALALPALSSVAAERAASPPSFPTEWQGNYKWCPQGTMPLQKLYTRRAECYLER